MLRSSYFSVIAWIVGSWVVVLRGSAAAQDVVHLSGPQGQQRIAGKIIDYTGKELTLTAPDGKKVTLPADRVERVETQQTVEQAEADKLFAAGDYTAAAARYEQARQKESRNWVRRQITAQIVWCRQFVGDIQRAGEEFLLLVRSDPATPYFDCIPLAWFAAEPSLPLEQAARRWLARSDSPVAVLMGASHLLSTGGRSEALRSLRTLSADPDRRIAVLAVAQRWRADAVTADAAQLAQWRRLVDDMPDALRAGPSYALSDAFAQHQQWEEAALAMLAAPILHPKHRLLASQALLGAGQCLDLLKQPREAAALYQELLKTYPDMPAVKEARTRLETLSKQEQATDGQSSDHGPGTGQADAPR